MEQIIEVDYDKELVEKYKNEYIMEKEGTGALEAEPSDKQNTVNIEPFENMIEPGEVVIYDKNN